MTFIKIDGTTSDSFKLGKNGVKLKTIEQKLVIEEPNGKERILGIDNIRIELNIEQQSSIATAQAVQEAIYRKIQTVSKIEDADLKNNEYVFEEKE